MAITLSNGRQTPLIAVVSFTYASLTDATAVQAVELPINATIIGGEVIVDTAWDSATSDVLDVGDGGDVNRYTPTQIDLQVLGRQSLDLSGYKYTAKDTVDVKWDGTGAAPSAGAARLIISYIIDGRTTETQ